MDDVQVSGNYSKRPLWQWILLYILIGLFIYGLIYYFVFARKSYTVQPVQQASSTTEAPASNIYLTKIDAKKGTYLTDFAGMTLYTYDKDTAGSSNCYSACATAWPPYTSGATAEKTFPTDITIITRTDGSKQFAWKGKPLYYYTTDTKPGDITGDGVGGVWHVVQP